MAAAHKEEDEWASKAQEWDSRPLIQQLTSAAAEALRAGGLLQPSSVVLELGCGTGLLAEKIADSLGSYVGVDTSPGMLAAFRSKLMRRSDGKLGCVLADLRDCQSLSQAAAAETGAVAGAGGTAPDDVAVLLPDQYDLVITHMTMHHIQDVHGMLCTLRSYLAPGGTLAVFDLLKEPGSDRFHNPQRSHSVYHPGGFAPEEMDRELSGAGLTSPATSVVAAFEKESFKDPKQLRGYHLLMATGQRPPG